MILAQVAGSTVGSYTYDALGERIQKVSGSATERYGYDEGRQLLSEQGATNRDYVWMDGIPVVNVDTSGTTSTLAYVTADQLGTPRAMSDASGTTEWTWPYAGNAWGESAPTSSGYIYNLRFPGQYFDQETGLSYNLNRNLDTSTGRYLQPDPLGLAAGASLYGYVAGNPLSSTDPLGLESPSAACGGGPGTYAWSICGNPPPPCTDPCGCKLPNFGLAATIIATEIVGGGPEDPLADAAVAGEIADAAETGDAAVTAYVDSTNPGALVTNITTDATADEAGATLQANGYTASTSADGQATIYTNAQGDTYVIRSSNSAPNGTAMDFYPKNGTPVKVNFGGPPHQP